MDEIKDFHLPSLAPHLKLSRAPDERGEPAYTIHNPASNAYFKIDWVAFECLSRFSLCKTAQDLKNAVERETTLKLDLENIKDIIDFLSTNGLLSLQDQVISNRQKKEQPVWKKIFHHYLYFSIPLFKPQAFLERTYPHIKFLHNPYFLKSMMVFLGVMVAMTLPRIDEFLHTFSAMISVEGAFAALLVFCFVKIIHEFAHAYTAIRYGVKVPHMGIAFMVMYPVLYTETTGSWALPSRTSRFNIGIAGITAELCLAAIFLAVWHIAPAGSMAQSISFLVVAVSLISSLLVNLNPLMRFDGYYLLSDKTGFDNLQHRACAFARYSIRKTLFGWRAAPPEDLPEKDARFLTVFGLSLLVYRFFLFTGIAILVYHLFFQPLGFILMMTELIWFIFLPIYSEIKIWWQNRDIILSSRRAMLPAFVIAPMLLVIFIPWKTTTYLPAIVHAGKNESIYPPYPARIEKMNVTNGASVEQGTLLATLVSPELEHRISTARLDLERLETLKRRGQNMVQTLQNNELSDVALEKARITLKGLESQRGQLNITAPFSGSVRDMGTEITEGRYVFPTDMLFTVVDSGTTAVTAYVTEDAREKISMDDKSTFVSEFREIEISGFTINRVSETGANTLQWTELSSIHGGPIASDQGPDGEIATRRTVYEVSAKHSAAAPPYVLRGYLRVSGARGSIFVNWIKDLISLFRQETNLG